MPKEGKFERYEARGLSSVKIYAENSGKLKRDQKNGGTPPFLDRDTPHVLTCAVRRKMKKKRDLPVSQKKQYQNETYWSIPST